jgi:hypothetical protein
MPLATRVVHWPAPLDSTLHNSESLSAVRRKHQASGILVA